MINTLDSSYTYNPLTNASSADSFQAPGNDLPQESSGKSIETEDSVSIDEDHDDMREGSKPNLDWVNEAGDNADDSSTAVAMETGKGPGDTKAEWNNPVRYRDKIFEKKISDPFLQKVYKGAKSVLDKEFKEYKKNTKGWNCYGWRDKFLSVKTDKNGEKVNTINPEMMDKLSAGIEKESGKKPSSIIPYYQTLPNQDYPNAKGHTYVYLQIKFDDGKEQWIFTEANASIIPSLGDGCVHYQTKAVNKPDDIKAPPPKDQMQIIQQNKEYA